MHTKPYILGEGLLKHRWLEKEEELYSKAKASAFRTTGYLFHHVFRKRNVVYVLSVDCVWSYVNW